MEAPFSVLATNPDVVVARLARRFPTDILRALGADLRSTRRQGRIYVLRALVSYLRQPVACFVDWAHVIGHPYSSGLGLGSTVASAGTILFKVFADVGPVIFANRADLGLAGAPTQIRMTAPEIDHVLEQLLETEPDDLYGLSTGEQLRVFPAPWGNDRSNNAKLDTQIFFLLKAGTLLPAAPEWLLKDGCLVGLRPLVLPKVDLVG